MSVFVGRVEELGVLGQIAGAAARGRVAAAIVLGDPGSGKSRLLAEAAARARLPNRFSVVGYEPESEVPLASVSDLLRALADATPQARRLGALVFGRADEEASPLTVPSGWSSRRSCSWMTCSGSTSSRSRSVTTSYGRPRRAGSRSR
jgi:hypothetical protein